MNGEPTGNGQRTNTILLAVLALLASSGWAYAGLNGDDTKEVRDSINDHDGDLKVLRVQVDYLLAERERDRRD